MRLSLKVSVVCTFIVACGWALFASFGEGAARQIARMLGSRLVRISDGKFADPIVFVHARLQDVLWIASISVVIIFALIGFDALLRKLAFYRRARGVWLGVILFIGVNAWWAASAHTALLWCLFYRKEMVDNFAQFQIKKALMPEQKVRYQIMLVGNSQVRTNLDEKVINRVLGGETWTTEVHQSSACGFDTLLLIRDLRRAKVELAVDYVSPFVFYGKTNGKVISQFIGWSDMPELIQWGGIDILPLHAVKIGLIGDVLSLVKYHESISQRVLGASLILLPQLSFNDAQDVRHEVQAEQKKNESQLGPVAEFEKRAFAKGIEELISRASCIVLIKGHFSPALERVIDPRIRTDLEAFLDSLEKRYPGRLFVLPEEDFIKLDESDYADVVHLNEEGQARFSESFAKELPKYLEQLDPTTRR